MRRALILGLTLVFWTSGGPSAHASEKVERSRVEGAPTLTAGTGPAYHLWHDATGWHLRFTGRSGVDAKRSIFTGLIHTPTGKLSMIRPAGMVGGDDSVNRLDGFRAMFKSEASSTLEGIDFKVADGAGSIYLELFVDYEVIGPQMVFLGQNGAHPTDLSPALHIDLTELPGPQPAPK